MKGWKARFFELGSRKKDSTNTFSEKRILTWIVALSLAARLLFADGSYAFWDEAVYLLNAQALAGMAVGYHELFLRPLIPSFLALPFSWLPVDSFVFVSRLLLSTLNALIVIPVYYLARPYSKRVAIGSATIVALLPLSVLESRFVMSDHLAALLVLSSLALLMYAVRNDNRKLVAPGSLLAGLAVITKFTAVVFAPLWFALAFVLFRRNTRNLWYLSTAALPVLVYLSWSWIVFGSPLHTVLRASHVVASFDPIATSYLLWLLLDGFGAFLLLACIGVFLGSRRQHHVLISAGFLIALLSALFFIFRGISKPPGILYEPQRFLIVAVLFAVILAVLTVHKLLAFLDSRYANVVFAATLVALLLIIAPAILRAYTPQIELESGLRESTKQMGLYLADSDIESFACYGNCPPLALYSGKQMTVYYDAQQAIQSQTPLVIFDQTPLRERIRFCSQESCAYLYEE